MKILHVIASLGQDTGGPAVACIGMAAALAKRGHRATIISIGDDRPPWLNSSSPLPYRGEFKDVVVELHPRSVIHRWGTSFSLYSALRASIPKSDVVHVHSMYLFHTWASSRLCRAFSVPYILRPHGTLDPYIRRRRRLLKFALNVLFQNEVLQRAAALHFTAEDEMRLARPYSEGAPGVVVPLGVDLSEFEVLPERGAFRAQHPEIRAPHMVLFLSRLDRKKGLDLLIPAFAGVVGAGMDAHLVIAGPDFGMRAAAEQWVAEHGLGDRVTFTGMITGQDRLAAFRDADLFVLPSYSENFGIAVVEAMACGLPVLISDKVNIWREIEADGAGVVVPCDVAVLTERMVALLGDAVFRAAMGASARESTVSRYTWDVVGPALEAMYENVIRNHADP